jgi:hypothetical protein
MKDTFSKNPEFLLKTIWRFDSNGVAITAFYDNHPDSIVYYDYQQLANVWSSIDTIDYQKILTRTLLTTQSMVKRFVESFKRQPDTIDAIFGEPWSHVSVRHINYERKTPFKLSSAWLHELVNRDIKNLKQKNAGIVSILDPEFSNPVYHRVMVSGHQIYDIDTQSVHNVRLDYTLGNLNTDISNEIMHIFSNQFQIDKKNIKFYHTQDIMMRFFANTGLINGCCIDLSGFITDVYVFERGMLQQWGTLPFGTMTMTRILAQKMHMTTNQLLILLRLYKKNLLANDTRKNIQELFDKIIISWKRDLQLFLGSAVVNGSIIDKVFWMGDNQTLLSFCINAVESEKIIFPVIFGTHEINNHSITSLLESFSSYESLSREITHDQDILIKIALSL